MKIRHLIALLFVGQFIYLVHIASDPWIDPDQVLTGLVIQLALVYGIAAAIDKSDAESAKYERRVEANSREADRASAEEQARRDRRAKFREAKQSNRAPNRTYYPGQATYTTPEGNRGWTPGFRNHLAENWNYVCPWCGDYLDIDQGWGLEKVDAVTIDHIEPQAKGGTDAFENLQPMHWGCNKRKRTSPMEQAPEAIRSRIREVARYRVSDAPWSMERHTWKRQSGNCFVCNQSLEFEEALFTLSSPVGFSSAQLGDLRASHADCVSTD